MSAYVAIAGKKSNQDRPTSVLGLLGSALEQEQIRRMKKFDRLDIDSLDSVIQLLGAYKNEIHSINET
jgi:hypothetical protein